MRNRLLLYINGTRHDIGGQAAFMTLSDYLRYEQGATGTKVVCAEGDCGACTVMLGRLMNGRIQYKPVNSCIQYLYQLDCSHIITVEGLKVAGALNPVQEAMIQCHGAQCGYCTPGFVVAMTGLFHERSCRQETAPVCEQEIRDALTGNLCRCTGYEPIIQAGLQTDAQGFVNLDRLYPAETMISEFHFARQEPLTLEVASFEGKPREAFIPSTLTEAVCYKAAHPDTVIIQGGTDVSVFCNKRGFEPARLLSLSNVADEALDAIRVEDGSLLVGARASLSALEAVCRTVCPELHAILETFGGPQIKQAGTLAGNIANGSPIADSIPFLMVMNAEIELLGPHGVRRVPMNGFYTGYKQTVMRPDELITRVVCPLPASDEILKLYKISRRRHLDISTFTAAIWMCRHPEGTIADVRIAYGGVGPVVMRLNETEAFLLGKPFALETFQAAGDVAVSEITPITDVRGSREYRLRLARNILSKFYYEAVESTEREVVPV